MMSQNYCHYLGRWTIAVQLLFSMINSLVVSTSIAAAQAAAVEAAPVAVQQVLHLQAVVGKPQAALAPG